MDLDENYTRFMKQYTTCVPAVRAYLRQLLPTWNDVDEVVQETSLVLWKKYEEFEQGTDFTRWACVVARFEALKYRRKKARDRHNFGDDLFDLIAEEALEENDRLKTERLALNRCLAKLAPKQREITLSAYSGDNTIREVAENFGHSATALYKALNRIRQSLYKCIKTEATQS
jgi:RNA polymerase sigma-70 factor, ECF subfamily